MGVSSSGQFLTRRLQTYPPELCHRIAGLLLDSFVRMLQEDSGPGGCTRPGRSLRVSAWGSKQKIHGGASMCVLNEETVRGTGVLISACQLGIYMHVDDGILVGDSRGGGIAQVDHWLTIFADSLEDLGFIVKERYTDAELTKAVGYEPCRHPAQLRMQPKRAIAVYRNLMTLLQS